MSCLAEEKMHLYASLMASIPEGLVIAGLLARTAARLVCRMHGRLEDRRGLESAIRDSEPGDRADVVRAYAECLAATRKPRSGGRDGK
jgi:hypothetical protein